MIARNNRICVGVIVGAKGIAGEVRIKNFTENPADVGAYGPVESEDGAKRWTLKVVGAARGAVTAKLTGVSDRNAAEALKGLKLFVDRAKLPDPGEGSYYHTDLVGLAVELTTGEAKGKVIAVLNFGGGDILEVGDGKTESTMVPFSNAAIAEVNMKEGFVRIVPLPGLFDDGEDSDEDMQQEGDDDNSNDNRPVKRRG